MTELDTKSWQGVKSEVMRRISNRRWLPGDLIPGEVELAEEFGCARATVNRALRELADSGLLDRKRKAGTRVTLNPVRKATVEIPVIRKDVESRGKAYSFDVLDRKDLTPSATLQRPPLRFLVCGHCIEPIPNRLPMKSAGSTWQSCRRFSTPTLRR